MVSSKIGNIATCHSTVDQTVSGHLGKYKPIGCSSVRNKSLGYTIKFALVDQNMWI